jgi:uncharacterized protein (DUF2062 family)
LVFKRREPLRWGPWLREQIYPRAGLKRSTRYILHRMKRLPDQPHRVARGVFAGSLIGFLPLPGLQFVGAWIAARLVQGNLLAALLATFNTNPITTPFFAVLAMTLGHWMLGIDKPLNAEYIGRAFVDAGHDLWYNFMALFGPEHTRWDGLINFWHEIYLPYFIGALGPGIILSAIGYYITIPLVTAYQKARAAKAKERAERRGKLRAMVQGAAGRVKSRRDSGTEIVAGTDDDSPRSP